MLWLTSSTTIAFPASPRDLRLVCQILQLPAEHQRQIRVQLRAFVARQRQQPLAARSGLLVREQNGSIQTVPWRLAEWLVAALDRSGPAKKQIAAWIEAALNRRPELSDLR